MKEENIKRLFASMLVFAVYDFRRLKKNGKEYVSDIYNIKELEEFFNSEYCHDLCDFLDVDYDLFLRNIDKPASGQLKAPEQHRKHRNSKRKKKNG